MPPETGSQSGRGRVWLSETPARVEEVCSQSPGRGNAWTSRFPHCAAPRRSHTQSAWSSEYEACRVEPPAVRKNFFFFFYRLWVMNPSWLHKFMGKSHCLTTEAWPSKVGAVKTANNVHLCFETTATPEHSDPIQYNSSSINPVFERL